MKVIFFSPKFYPEPNYYFNDVVFDLQKVNKIILCGKQINIKDCKLSGNLKGIKTYYIPYIGRSKNNDAISLIFEYISFFIASLFVIPIIAFKEKPNRIFYYGISPPIYILPFIVIKPFLNFKIIYWIQDIWPESIFLRINNSNFLSNILNIFMNLIYRFSDYLLIISENFRTDKRFQKYENKLIYIPQGFKMNSPSMTDTKSNLIINRLKNEKKKSIIYAGNISNSMYLEEMAEAVEKNSHSFVFHIVGDGSLKQRLVDRNFKSVFFYDFVEREYILDIVKAADFSFLGREITDDTNRIISHIMPAKLAMYVACKIPIISITRFHLFDLIKKNNLGYPINYTNNAQLSDELNAILGVADERLSLIKDSHEDFYNKNFNHKNILNKIYNIIHK